MEMEVEKEEGQEQKQRQQASVAVRQESRHKLVMPWYKMHQLNVSKPNYAQC